MRYLAIIFAICFILSAIVQYNDPDPAAWMILYGIGAVTCLLFLLRKLPQVAYLVLGVLYLGIAVYQWPPEFEGFLFGEVHTMRSINIELARESFGMGIVGVAMLLFWFSAKK